MSLEPCTIFSSWHFHVEENSWLPPNQETRNSLTTHLQTADHVRTICLEQQPVKRHFACNLVQLLRRLVRNATCYANIAARPSGEKLAQPFNRSSKGMDADWMVIGDMLRQNRCCVSLGVPRMYHQRPAPLHGQSCLLNENLPHPLLVML